MCSFDVSASSVLVWFIYIAIALVVVAYEIFGSCVLFATSYSLESLNRKRAFLLLRLAKTKYS